MDTHRFHADLSIAFLSGLDLQFSVSTSASRTPPSPLLARKATPTVSPTKMVKGRLLAPSLTTVKRS